MKITSNFSIVAVVIVLIFILCALRLHFRIFDSKESMTNVSSYKDPKVILLGDSILNNTSYVPSGESVISYLRQSYQKDLYVYAQDGASINDVYRQLDDYLDSDLEDKGTHVVISVGGNNILNALRTNSLNDEMIDRFVNQYIKMIEHISVKFPSIHAHVLNIYYPEEEVYKKIAKYIKRWNDSIKAFVLGFNEKDEEQNKYKGKNKNKGRTLKIDIIRIDGLLTKDEDFSHEIEPSAEGGRKIADAIIDRIDNDV